MGASPAFTTIYSDQGKAAQFMPTYLNQLGRQSSLLSQASPSVKRPVTQPLHLGELGQLKNGMCWYPMSRNLECLSVGRYGLSYT
jgi:hypothetical protein